MRFALVSHVLPPAWSGQAMALYRLLRELDPDQYCLLSRERYDGVDAGYSGRLPARYYHLRPEHLTRGGWVEKWRERLGVAPRLFGRAVEIARVARRERCGAVVACTGNLLDLPAAYLASRLVGIPFYPYFFDDYSEQWVGPRKRLLARRFEPFAVKGAAGTIVPNEFMAEALRRRYGIEATLVRNACDLEAYEALEVPEPLFEGEQIRIVYTGAVYEAHYDAFRNLIAAIESLGRADVRLQLYTKQSAASLADAGIRGPVDVNHHVPLAVMPRIQREAHLLFLPLAFASPYPRVIATSAPGKMAEYLAASRPTLVHAPPGSFVAWYFRKHACGLVVDKDDERLLARALEDLLADAALRTELASRAWERVKADFDVADARAVFLELVNRAGR